MEVQVTPLAISLRQQLQVDEDPVDPVYRERHTTEMVDGFRVLCLLVLASMTLLLVVRLAQAVTNRSGADGAPTAIACALVACAGGVGLLAAKSVRSANAAFVATAALLTTTVGVLSIDRLVQAGGEARPANPLIPLIFSILVLSAAVLPLRPNRVLALGALLVASVTLTTGFTLDVMSIASAATVVAVSVFIAARSTSHRIRIHHAHLSAMEAERQTEVARQRALIAESVITMERLAASLSHEMNTPIGTLKSAAETLIRGVKRDASFPGGSAVPRLIEELADAMTASTARLTETVARIQRFANLDRSAVRLVDINQLVRDAVALMNPPSVKQTHLKLNLSPLPHVWCTPHGLNVAIASILNRVVDSVIPATIDTYCEGAEVVVKVACASSPADEFRGHASPGFAVVGGRVRASGWDLFAARQLVREDGGELKVEKLGDSEQSVMIILPANSVCAGNVIAPNLGMHIA
jgi:signal transduction histidine kinase